VTTALLTGFEPFGGDADNPSGTFVCNHVFFTALEAAASATRAGFVHVPWSAEHAPSTPAPTLPIADIARALEIAVRTSLDVASDPAAPGGTLH
jgi:pyroglutamyl-peptidase